MPKDVIKVGFMSNLIPEKGIFEFLEVIKKIKSSEFREKFEFWIVGGDSQE